MQMQNLSSFGTKDCLTEANSDWKCFGNYNKDREFHTINDKYFRDFLCKLIKGGKCGSFNRYFESEQFDEIMLTIEKICK